MYVFLGKAINLHAVFYYYHYWYSASVAIVFVIETRYCWCHSMKIVGIRPLLLSSIPRRDGQIRGACPAISMKLPSSR